MLTKIEFRRDLSFRKDFRQEFSEKEFSKNILKKARSKEIASLKSSEDLNEDHATSRNKNSSFPVGHFTGLIRLLV